jgi:glycosyltransferase involved in cell wall biosynthesis
MLVSIYMPTKNRVALLQRAVESVLTQTHAPLELLVVNDGSTDGTKAYLDSVAAQDARLRAFHHETSRGAPASRNLAISSSRGEFITGLDDDDSFHRERIAALVQAWRAREATGERFSCLFTQDLYRCGDQETVSVKPARVEYEDLFFFNTIGNQVFTRREYLIGAGMFDEQMPAWQDLDTFLRVLHRYGPALLLDRPLYLLDLDPRTDRISVGSKARILSAYRRLIGKNEHHPPAFKQGLFLQVFSRLYGHRVDAADVREFLRFGLHRRTFRTFAGVMLRQAGLLR